MFSQRAKICQPLYKFHDLLMAQNHNGNRKPQKSAQNREKIAHWLFYRSLKIGDQSF